MALRHCTGSCHCGSVRYEATIDLSKGTFRCNCSICKMCGIRIYATGDAEFMGGRFYALAVATFDDVTTDELAAAPLKFNDNLHDRFDRPPADTRLT